MRISRHFWIHTKPRSLSRDVRNQGLQNKARFTITRAYIEKAIATIQAENDRVRIREWRFEPGSETGWHRHEHDFVVVPQTNGRLCLEAKNGESYVGLIAGNAYTRLAGVEHNVTNASEHEVVLLEIDLL